MSVTLRNYIKASPKTGRLSYRRRIPVTLQQYFTKEDGSLRGLEWNEALGTKSKSIALRKATEINERFERTKALAKQLVASSSAKDKATQEQRIAQVVDYFRKQGLHPDQAPNIFAPRPAINAFLSKTKEARRKLLDYQIEVGIEVTGDPGNETYATNERYEDVQAEIDFLKGNSSKIKNKLKPTWEVAVEEYLSEKEAAANYPPEFHTEKSVKRIIRIADDFARFLGSGSLTFGNQKLISEVSRQDAKLFVSQESKKGRTPVTVGRDIVALSAIYTLAQKEYGQKDPDLNTNGNPFSGLRGRLESQDETAVRKGQRVKNGARAWSASEVKQLTKLLPKMNDEARLCVKLAIYTGARLQDVCGLMVDELTLKGDEDSLIHIRHNAFRKVSKDSIERKIPLYGEMLQELKQYVSERDFSSSKKLTPRYSKEKSSAESLSNLVNQRYIDKYISEDPTLKPHGFRNTLQARFDATDVSNKLSGYLIGWKDQETVGMQKAYNKQGYPHSQLLQALKACHAANDWAV